MADGIRSYPQGGLGALPAARDEGFPVPVKRISWGSVFAGVAVATVAELLFALLGLAIGLSTVDPTRETYPFSGLGIGAAAWWVVSSLISLFLGGWIAGRLAGMPRRFDGAVHGVLTWAIATFLMIYFLGTALGNLIGGAMTLVRSGVSAAAQAASAAVPEGTGAGARAASGAVGDSIRREAQQLLRQSEQPALQPEALRRRLGNISDEAARAAMAAAGNPQEAGRIMDSVLGLVLNEARPVAAAANRDAAVNILVARTGMDRAQAQQVVDNWIAAARQASGTVSNTVDSAKQQARRIGEDVAHGVAQASFWSFLVILLGGVCAGGGGIIGAPGDLRAATPGAVPAGEKRG